MRGFVIDSNVLYIAAAQIGEAWAAVVLEEIAKGRISAQTTSLLLAEVLDLYHGLGEYYIGKNMHAAYKRIIGDPLSVTEEDFRLSMDLHSRNPECSPRELLTAAVMLNNGLEDIISIDGPVYEGIENIRRVSLDKLLKTLNLKGNYVYERVK